MFTQLRHERYTLSLMASIKLGRSNPNSQSFHLPRSEANSGRIRFSCCVYPGSAHGLATSTARTDNHKRLASTFKPSLLSLDLPSPFFFKISSLFSTITLSSKCFEPHRPRLGILEHGCIANPSSTLLHPIAMMLFAHGNLQIPL